MWGTCTCSCSCTWFGNWDENDLNGQWRLHIYIKPQGHQRYFTMFADESESHDVPTWSHDLLEKKHSGQLGDVFEGWSCGLLSIRIFPYVDLACDVDKYWNVIRKHSIGAHFSRIIDDRRLEVFQLHHCHDLLGTLYCTPVLVLAYVRCAMSTKLRSTHCVLLLVRR